MKLMNRFTRIISVVLLSISFSSCQKQTSNDIYPESISISGPKYVAKNSMIRLSVDFDPISTTKRNISWSIDNNEIASIDSTGLLTGREVGNVRVTATSIDAKDVSAQFDVMVLERVVPVSSISLDKTNATIFINQQDFQLNATIFPDDASDKSLIWSTSDSTIADVSNSGVVTAKKVGNVTISATTNDGGYVASCLVDIIEQPKAKWTVMIYMCGADLESDVKERLATSDINEILSVDNKPNDINIIIETGGAKSWDSTFNIDKDHLQRWHVDNKKLILNASLTKANMGKVDTFQSFLEWGLSYGIMVVRCEVFASMKIIAMIVSLIVKSIPLLQMRLLKPIKKKN